MTKTYIRADESVADLLAEVRRDYHPVLTACEVTVDILMEAEIEKETGITLPSLKVNRYPALACIKATSLKERALGLADAILTIDAYNWEQRTDRHIQLIDHELTHLEVMAEPLKKGAPGGVVRWDQLEKQIIGRPLADDLGRPKLTMRLHDWELGGFRDVATRHREKALEVEAVRSCRTQGGQYFWDWSETDAILDSMLDGYKARALGVVAFCDNERKGDGNNATTR